MTRLPRLLLIVALAVPGLVWESPRPIVRLDAGSHSGQAQVRRDEYGVPHILADTGEAAAFAHS